MALGGDLSPLPHCTVMNHTIVTHFPSRGIIRPVADLVGELMHSYRRSECPCCVSDALAGSPGGPCELRHGLGYKEPAWPEAGEWQGKKPVSFRRDIVDLECQSCGWHKPDAARQPYPFWWKAAPEVM